MQSLQHLTPWEQSTAFWALTPAWKQRTSTVISIPVNWHCLSTVNSYCLILLLWDEQRFRAQGEETSKPPLEGLRRRSGSLQLLPRAARRLQDRIMRWDCSAGGKAQSSLCPENGICIYRPQLLEAEKHLQCCFWTQSPSFISEVPAIKCNRLHNLELNTLGLERKSEKQQ